MCVAPPVYLPHLATCIPTYLPTYLPLTRLHHFRVLARMTPELKERVVRMMRREGGRTVLMCGDGANDVGALKQVGR